MAVQGRNFSWTVVWNKLYTKELWDRCYPMFVEFSHSHGHMIMWEDIAFSSALWANTRKVTNVHGVLYFYYRHQNASTLSAASDSHCRKYLADSSGAIAFFEKALRHSNAFARYEQNFQHWKQNSMHIVYRDLIIQGGKNALKHQIVDAFGCSDSDYQEPESFFYSITTPLGTAFERMETIKCAIASGRTKYVSFDVFDTLIRRPFFYPVDLFQLLSVKFNEPFGTYIDFKRIRQEAERYTRENSPHRSEITLDEIYEYIKDHYAFDHAWIKQIQDYEVALELDFCEPRQSGRMLFELAMDCGKQIIICSDMYLPQESIEQLLHENGFSGYDRIYVSSKVGETKHGKKLFKHIQRDLMCDHTDRFVHIGDNLDSDVRHAAASGWQAYHLPKATDILQNFIPDVYGGEAFNLLYNSFINSQDYVDSFRNFTAERSIAAVIANKFFDNPFVCVNPLSDFNANPQAVGYATLGPHLLALSRWIHENAEKYRIGTIHFVARDGYLVKRAFDACGFGNVRTNYIRLSRKALLLADIHTPEEIYSLLSKMNTGTSPRELTEYFAPIIPDSRKKELEDLFSANGIPFDRRLKDHAQWARCTKVLISDIIDMTLLPVYQRQLRDYFSEIIKPGDFIFDIGYSGRPESALTSLLGYPVGSLYIHVNSEIAQLRQSRHGYPSEVFYGCKPGVTGVIREHLLMEMGPSTIGYRYENGKMEPILEDYEPEYCGELITRIVQDSAIEFVQDYVSRFKDFEEMFIFANDAICAPFEYYLHHSKAFDRRMFSTLTFEDDLGLGKKQNTLEFWDRSILRMNVCATADAANPMVDMYMDGYFVKLYTVINRLFPKGGKMRNRVKKIAGIFLK